MKTKWKSMEIFMEIYGHPSKIREISVETPMERIHSS